MLNGKTALITGASRGIGRGIACKFAQNGAFIGINYLSNEKGAKETLIQDIKGNNPLQCINRICPRPLLIIAGENDTFMPLKGIKKLFEKAQSPKEFKLVENADHNLTNYFARFETFSLIKEFFIDNLKHNYMILQNLIAKLG